MIEYLYIDSQNQILVSLLIGNKFSSPGIHVFASKCRLRWGMCPTCTWSHTAALYESNCILVYFSGSFQDAVKLAKLVKYVSAGTVEYLYTPEDKKYYFLELNPRLQARAGFVCSIKFCTKHVVLLFCKVPLSKGDCVRVLAERLDIRDSALYYCINVSYQLNVNLNFKPGVLENHQRHIYL